MRTRRILIQCTLCGEKFIRWEDFKDHATWKHPLEEVTARETYGDYVKEEA